MIKVDNITERISNDQNWKIWFFGQCGRQTLSNLWIKSKKKKENIGPLSPMMFPNNTFARIFSAPMAIPAWASPPRKGWLPTLEKLLVRHLCFSGIYHLRSMMISCMFGAGVILVPKRVRTLKSWFCFEVDRCFVFDLRITNFPKYINGRRLPNIAVLYPLLEQSQGNVLKNLLPPSFHTLWWWCIKDIVNIFVMMHWWYIFHITRNPRKTEVVHVQGKLFG